MQRNSKPMAWRAHGLSDTEDASSTFNGAMSALHNLVPDPQSAKVWYCRPAAMLAVDLNSPANQVIFQTAYGAAYSSSGFISVLVVIGDIAYGMMAGGNGVDVPFTFNLANSTVVPPTGVSIADLPASPLTAGAWIPPQLALVGAKLVLTHQGFSGAGGNFFGWFDVTTPAMPVWNAGNMTGLFSFTTVPTAVAQFNGRAYFITNVPAQPAVVFSDVLDATNVTTGNQILTFGDNAQLTALAGLPLANQLGGIIQSLMVFKDDTNIYQITGDALTNNLSINSLNLQTGTRAPNSIASTPKGLAFISPEGMRIIDFDARVSDPIGFDGNGITSPFSQSVVPSRINGSSNGSLYRVVTQNGSLSGAPTFEYWYDVTRQIWSGPHTCSPSMIAPWRGTFIIAPIWQQGALFQSDTFQSITSSFTENSAQLAWTWQTPLLPDTDEMVDICVTETTLDIGFAPSAVVTLNFADQSGAALDTTEVVNSAGVGTTWGAFTWGAALWGGPTSLLAPIQIPWHFPLVFPRGSFTATGESTQQIRIGALHLRYQPTRHYTNANVVVPTVLTDETTAQILTDETTGNILGPP